MGTNDTTLRGIESLESQAEKYLSEARAKAAEMLREANEEAERILSSSPSLDDAKAECEAILADARARAEKTAEESRRQADRIRDRAKNRDREKVDRIVREATAIVRGTE